MAGEFIGIAGVFVKTVPQGQCEAPAWQVDVSYQDPGRNPALSVQLKWVNEQKWQSVASHVG